MDETIHHPNKIRSHLVTIVPIIIIIIIIFIRFIKHVYRAHKYMKSKDVIIKKIQ